MTIAAVDRGRKLPDAGVAAKSVAFLQQAKAVTQRARDRTDVAFHLASCHPGQLLGTLHGKTGAGPGTNIAQHRTRFDRGQLIAIAEEDDPGMRRQGVNQTRHHGQVDHRGLIHHQHIQM